MTTPKQMTLTFNLQDDQSFENFFPGDNKQLLVKLMNMARGRGNRLLYLWGASGVGKTHLLNACCYVARQLRLQPFYLPLTKINQLSPSVFEDLETLNLICIDDLEMIAGKKDWEEAFFHFFNRMREEKKRLIVSGNALPKELAIKLPDIRSRLTSGLIYQVKPLNDEMKIETLIMRARLRGLDLTNDVAQFLLRRLPRNMNDLLCALQTLDQSALEEQRKLTIPFVKKVLDF